MITLVKWMLRRLARQKAKLPVDPFGEPPRESATPADPFFEGVKAASGSHQGFQAS
jgi:hypothetical protein